jgi:hypothetical protein
MTRFRFSQVVNGPDGKAIRTTLIWAGSSADEFAQCENNQSLGDEFVSTDGERRQGGCTGRKTWGHAQRTVIDMFWGDRCGTVFDPEGYGWMVATHIAEPTPQEMKEDEGPNVQSTKHFSGISCCCHGPLMMVHRLYIACAGGRLVRVRRPELIG